ncbi:MAG: methyltransferase [Thermodesulfobacteriota bacterium]
MNDAAFTRDAILEGKFFVRQPRRGYRFSIDAVCLAFFVRADGSERAADLGCGCGIIPLLLSHRFPGIRVWGVEKQVELAELAARNIAENGLSDTLSCVCMDLRELPAGPVTPPFDLVVSNPPFHRTDSSRVSPDFQRAAARHEIFANAGDVAAAAGRLLAKEGRLCLIYPADRLPGCLDAMKKNGIRPARLRMVHSRQGEEAELALVCGVKGERGELQTEGPLLLFDAPGVYSAEAAAMIAGKEFQAFPA